MKMCISDIILQVLNLLLRSQLNERDASTCFSATDKPPEYAMSLDRQEQTS